MERPIKSVVINQKGDKIRIKEPEGGIKKTYFVKAYNGWVLCNNGKYNEGIIMWKFMRYEGAKLRHYIM